MLFQRRRFFVKERVSLLKLTDTYDILDPETRLTVGIAKEEPPTWAKLLRLIVKKQLLPTTVNVYESESAPPVLWIEKRPAFFHTNVIVKHRTLGEIGRFKTKWFSFGGAFHVFDKSGQKIGDLKGDWKGWNFKLTDARGQEMGVVTKKWGGIGRELFTTADNYMVSLDDKTPAQPDQGPLMLAAGLAIDVVYKEAA